MKTRSPVEVTTRFATTVHELSDAWAFVMDKIDQVGPDPSIAINPVWRHNGDGLDPRHFEVAISGMVEQGEGED